MKNIRKILSQEGLVASMRGSNELMRPWVDRVSEVWDRHQQRIHDSGRIVYRELGGEIAQEIKDLYPGNPNLGVIRDMEFSRDYESAYKRISAFFNLL